MVKQHIRYEKGGEVNKEMKQRKLSKAINAANEAVGHLEELIATKPRREVCDELKNWRDDIEAASHRLDFLDWLVDL